jgi:1,4-dihydroxy-2-naphthoyl-CoA synthase
MAYEQIKYEVSENILTITLNRPERLNAFTATMQRELIDAFDQADHDPSSCNQDLLHHCLLSGSIGDWPHFFRSDSMSFAAIG